MYIFKEICHNYIPLLQTSLTKATLKSKKYRLKVKWQKIVYC